MSFVKAHPVTVLGALGAAFALTGFKAAQFAEQIDKNLRRVDALLPKTTTGVDRMRQRLIALAQQTPVPLEALAEGLETVVKLGAKNPEDAFTQLAASAKLAQIAGVDLKDAIGSLDQIMDSFHLNAADTGKVLDSLAVAAQHGAPLQELAPVLNLVGAQAHAAGISVSEIVAAIGTLTESGVPAKQAAAAIREAFGVVDESTDVVGKKQSSLGIQLKVVGGQLQFTGQAADDYNRTLAEMTGKSGQADVMIGKLTGSLTDQGEVLRNQLKVAWLEFGEASLPIVTKLTRLLVESLEFWSGAAADNLMTAHLRELATGWKMVNTESTDAARKARVSAVGMETVKNAVADLAEMFHTGGVDLDRLRRSLAKMPEGELRPLAKALTGLTDDQRAQLGITAEQLQQFIHVINQTQLALARAHAANKPDATPVPGATPEELQRQMQLRQEMASRLASLTQSVADDLQVQLDALLAKLHLLPENMRGEFMAGITRLRGEISSARTFEGMDKELEAIERRVNQINDALGEVPATIGMEILPSVQALIDQLVAAQAQTQVGSTQWIKYRDQIDRANELVKKLVKNIGNAGQGQTDINTELDKTLDRLELQASRIQNAVRGAIQLGEAFGLVDANMSQALQSITQIATAIPQVSAVLKAGGSFTKALPGILSIAGGVASLIGSIFGPDPEEEHRKEVLRANTEALHKLTDRIGELGQVDVTGSQFSNVQSLLAQLQSKSGFMTGKTGIFANLRNWRELRVLEQQMGISAAELKEFAAALGITFAQLIPTVQELRQLNEALAQTQLTQFAQTFTGQIDLLSREFDLFDISDPLEQLQKLRDVAQGFAQSPLVDALFGGLDLQTEAGRAALEKRIRDLYAQLQAGTITPGQLGGLTPQQLLDLLSQLETTMDQVAQGQSQGQTSQFQVSREITETTAGRLVSLGVTSLLWQEQTAVNTQRIADMLAGNPGALQPPSAAELAAYNPGGVVIEQLVIQVSVPGASASDAQRIGDDVGRAAAAAFDRELGAKLRKRALLQGSVTRN